jgi:hypothetical protein
VARAAVTAEAAEERADVALEAGFFGDGVVVIPLANGREHVGGVDSGQSPSYERKKNKEASDPHDFLRRQSNWRDGLVGCFGDGNYWLGAGSRGDVFSFDAKTAKAQRTQRGWFKLLLCGICDFALNHWINFFEGPVCLSFGQAWRPAPRVIWWVWTFCF